MILHGREVEVHVDNIEPFINELCVGFKILWSGDIGWGEYTLYRKANENTWFFDDECMEDPKNDKTFLKLLLEDFAKQLEEEE